MARVPDPPVNPQDKIPLIVTDLDGTLIPGDSLRALLVRQLREGPWRLSLFAWAAARAIGLASSARLMAAIVRSLRARPDYAQFVRSLAAGIRDRLDADLITDVQSQAPGATMVLCSASPADYVAPLARMLGWEAVCSSVEADGRVFRCHGGAKRDAILLRYPPTRYRYVLSVADSSADQPLQEMFETFWQVRWVGGKRYREVATGLAARPEVTVSRGRPEESSRISGAGPPTSA